MTSLKKGFYGVLIIGVMLVQTGCAGRSLFQEKTYILNEPIQITDQVSLTLQYWDISMDRLIVSFEVENKSTEKFFMHGTFALLHQQKGTKDLFPLAFVNLPGSSQECASTLYGYVMPGEKMGGTVCWENISQNGISFPLKMRYSLHTFDPFKKSVARWKLETHTVGETVQLNNNITITVNRAMPLNDGDGLRLDYTVKNLNSTKYYFDPTFQILRQQKFSGDIASGPAGQDGCDPTPLGYIQPGQEISGNVCWRGLKQVSLKYPFQVVFGPPVQKDEAVWVINQ